MDRYDLLQYINAYNLQPYAFDDESVDLLEQYSKDLNVPFQRNMDAEEQKQTGVIGQFLGGITEGFLPLPFDMAEDPVTSAEQISRSVGSLIGFVPGLLGGPLAWAGKGALKLGAKGALATGARAIESGGKFLQSEIAKSIPMRGADYLLGKEVGQGVIAKLGSAGATADRFMKGTTVGGDIAKASVHLGTASLVSEVWEGPSAMFDSFVHGAVAGGAFGAIGNYQNLLQKATGSSGPVLQKMAENKLMEGTFKAMAGAGFQGGLTASYDAPTAVVIYETLLGGYFGATHPSVQVRTGREWFTRYSADPAKKQHEMLKDPAFESLDPQVKKVVEDLHFQDIGEMYNRHLQDTQNIDYFDRSSAAQLLRNQFKDKIYEEYSTKNNIERNKLTDKEKTEALKEEIEPTLQIMEIIREGNQISDEILRKSPKDLTGETKEVYKKLTEDEIAKIEKGEFEPVYNYLISRNDFFKTWTAEQNGKDVLRMEEQVEIQAELDRNPPFRKFIQDIKPQIKKDITDIEIAQTSFDSFKETYLKAIEKKQSIPEPKIDELNEVYHVTNMSFPKTIQEKKLKPFSPEVLGSKEKKAIYLSELSDWSGRFNDQFRFVFDKNNATIKKAVKGPRYAQEKELLLFKELQLNKENGLKRIELKTTPELNHYLAGGLAQDLPTWKPSLDSYLSSQLLKKDALNVRSTYREQARTFAEKFDVPVILEDRVEAGTKYREIFSKETAVDRYDEFKKDIYKKFQVNPTNKIDRELRQAYEQFRQNKPQQQYEYNLQTGTLSQVKEYNSLGVRKPLFHPKLPHEEIYGYEGKSYVINETVVNGRSYNPLGKMFKKSPTGEYEYTYVMEKGDWNRMLLNIQKNDKNSYMWLSEKDKGKLIVRPLHPNTRNYKANQVFNKEELATLYRDRGEFYKLVGVETSSKEVKDQWSKYHEEMAISNKLYDPIGEFKNALELVKRSSVMSSKDYALDPAKFQDIAPDGIDVIMVNDSKSAKYLDKPETYKVQVKGKGKKFSEEKIYDSDVDGYVVMHTKLFNKIVESMGLDPSTSHIKPTIATKIDGRMFILKGGIHPSQQGFDNAMVNPNSMIVMTSAGKVHPGKEYIGKVDKNGAYRFYNENAKGGLDIQKNPERFKLPVEKLLVNLGVYGDSHAVDPVTIKRQFHSVLNGLNMGGKYKAGYDALMGEFRKSFDGEAEQNEMVRRMLSKPTMEIPKEFDISKIGHKEIVDIFNQSQSNSPLLKLLMKDIIKDYKNIKQSEEISEPDLLEAKSYINRLEKQLKDTNYNVIAVRYLDAGSENFNDAVLRYIKNKYLTPKWDYSASSWVAGVHPLFKHSLNGKEIKKDHFMLGHSMGDMKHAEYGTLKEAWKEYQKIKDSKKKKDFKEEHLRIAIMRVPSPDVSGTRVLYFDGFAKKGTTPDYGTYMRQKDHFYIDGADVDGDKVFLYQNMPKEFLDAVKAKKDNLELNGIMKQNKAEEFNPEYDLSASNPAMKRYINSKASQYMPNALYRTGRSSFVGKDGMGQVVTAKEYLGIVFSDIMKKGGVINIPLFDKKGNQYAVLKGRMDPNDLTKMDGYFTHAVEASSRTADSSTYYDLIDPRQMQNKLLKKGMPNARLIAVKNGKETGKLLFDSVKKKPVELEYRMLRDSRDYGDLFTLKNAIYNGKDFAGRKYKLREVQEILEKAEGMDKTFQSSLAYLSANMSRHKLNTNLLRLMDYKTYNRLLESVNKAMKENPAIGEAIKRNTMLIRPDYGKYRSKNENVTDRELEQILKLNDATDLHSILMVTKAEELLSKDMMAKGIGRDEINRITMDMALKAVEHKDALVKVRKLSSIHKKNVNINQLSDVEKMIRDYKREIKDIANQYDMPSNRFTDFYEMYMLGSLYPQSKPSKQVEMENKAILDTGREVQKRRKSGKENLDYELSYLQEKVDNHLKHFNKTSQHRYPYESNEISNKNKKIFISSFGNTFNLMRGRSEILQEVAKEPAVQQIKERVKGSEEGPKTEQQKDQQLKEDINDYLQPQANLFDFKVEGKVQAPADVKKAARDIVDIFKQFGEHSQEHLSDMFVAMTNARDGVSYGIEKATFRDIKDFRNFLQDQLHAGAKDGKPSILTQFLFPRRIAEKQFIHDWQTAETIKGLPFRDIKGNYGWTDIRVPLGTMKGLQNSFRNVYNMQNSSINYGQEERDKHFWWRKDILDLPDGVAKAQELQDLAMKHYLQDAGQRMQLEYNQAQWQKSKKAYEKLSKKEFTIVRDNKRVQVSGKEMMDIVAESNASYLKGLYNKWVKSGLDFTLIDPDAELQLTANYKAFNKQSPLLKYNETTGKSNVETLFKTLINPITKGKQNFDRLIGKGGFTTELLYRLQYEYQLEKFIRENKPSNPKKFREDYRQTKSEIFEDADQVTKYIRSKTAFAGVGEVKDKYWPHMFHMDTVSGRKEAEAFMERKRNELQLSLQDQIAKEMGVLKETGFEYTLDERFPLTKSDRSYIISGEQSESIAVRGNPNKVKGGTQKSRAYEIIDRKVAELENMFEQTLGSALTADNGSGEHGARWLLGKYANKEEAVNDGFFSRPGSGRARGKEPMPGFSYDFKVIEAYQDQWINAFYKSATALASKKQIDLYEQANPLKDKKLTEEWSNIMKDYASDVMGYDGMYSRSELSLSKQQLANRRSIIKKYESGNEKVKRRIGEAGYNQAKEDLKIHNRIKNKIGDTVNNAFYYVGDKAVVNGLEKLSKKFWMGGEENAPKLPIWGELPKSPEARRKTLSRIANQIGNAEAKYSLISLLSHPKTAVGNLLGGSHNTIANAGLSNFVDASFNRKKLLATIFRGAKLKDGTPITTKDHLIRFAEENGAIESFMVTEGSLERNFQFKEAKAMWSELTNFRKNNPDKRLSIGEIRDLAKKYKVTEAAVQAGALAMRVSERKLRSDSFYAHYLNAYNNLRSVIPDLRYDNPYVLNMALKGVEATQFLYHSAFRPKYSRTSLGKVLTRFHPFAWNSIRFRRLTYKRAKRYGFREGTQDFNTMRRLLTLDMFALAMANVFVSSIFDSTLPPPLSWMQDASDWMFGDEKERDRAFFSSWPHPALAPLQIATPPVARFALTPINAMINGNWDRFADYYLWTFFPFGRLGRSVKKTFEVPEMWLEQMTGIPIHAYAREIDKT